MSSRQHTDFQYEQFQAAWLASQNGASQLNVVGGGLQGFEGARHGQHHASEFGQFNRSSIPLAMHPSATADSILRIAAQVDHDALLHSGNPAYAKVLEDHDGTKEELASLKRAFDVLVRTRSDSSVPSDENELGSGGLRLRYPTGMKKRMAYSKEDLPLIKFWTRKSYEVVKNRASKKVIKSSTEESSSLPFMELENGNPITDATAVEMRLTARGIFTHLLNEGTAPAKWGQVSVVAQDFFFNVIAERYPYAAMCENMWKMQLLATTCYPSWHRNHKEELEEQRRDFERQQREKIWIEQQLEHGRQLKEEVIEQVDLAAKRMRSEDDTDGSELRPSKKGKTATHRAKIPPLSSSSRNSQPLSSASRSSPSGTSITIPKPPSAESTSTCVHQMGDRLEPPLASPAYLAADGSFVQDVPTSAPPMTPEPLATNSDENQQTLDPLASSASIPVVEDWAYDRSGLDSTNTQETALDRLSVYDSTPYVASPFDQQQISLETMPSPLETASTDTSLLREDVHDEGQAMATAADLSIEDDGEREVRMSSSPPFGTTDSGEPTRHNTPEPSEPETRSSDSRDISAAALLALHGERTLGRIRPTADQPYPYSGATTSTDFETTFDRNIGRALPAVRNPLGSLIAARIPSVNVAPDLTSLNSPAEEGKENDFPKARGRGRPAGKKVQPDQLIKPTKESLTPRNLYALEYKETTHSCPTEEMWRSLGKDDLQRFEALSRERKAVRSKAKVDAKAVARTQGGE